MSAGNVSFSHLNFQVGVDVGAKTGWPVDAAYVFETSGEAVFLRFLATNSQTSGNLDVYFYCNGAPTGTPTYKCELRNGGTTQSMRPEVGGAQIAVTADVSPTTDTWMKFSFTNVSLTTGLQYYLIVYNTHATPVSNYCSWIYRGALDQHGYATGFPFQTGYTDTGFTTNPTVTSSCTGCAVLKYSNGDIVGNPYVNTEAHAGNTNHRGIRVTFTADVVTWGLGYIGGGSAVTREMRIYQGASLVVAGQLTEWAESGDNMIVFADQTLSANTAYDLVLSPGAGLAHGNIYTMGMVTPPADILAAKPQGVLGYVDGATPGSLTLDDSRVLGIFLYIKIGTSGAGGGVYFPRNNLS